MQKDGNRSQNCILHNLRTKEPEWQKGAGAGSALLSEGDGVRRIFEVRENMVDSFSSSESHLSHQPQPSNIINLQPSPKRNSQF